jgi:hypothetical protein
MTRIRGGAAAMGRVREFAFLLRWSPSFRHTFVRGFLVGVLCSAVADSIVRSI